MKSPTENHQAQSDSAEKNKEFLQERINRATIVIDNLEHNQGWETILSDMGKERQRLDDTWQYVTDPVKFNEFRVTKMAVMKIINIVEHYKFDRSNAIAELYLLENPDKVVAKDYQEK